jgi:hypothetical protein
VLTALLLLVACLAPAAVLGVIFSGPRWFGAVAEAWRRRSKPASSLTPTGPPLEQLAADLRRLRPQYGDTRRSWVQRQGARLAYEDVLRQAAAALDLPHDLTSARSGLARELELLRLEQALLDAGVALSVR